MASFLSKVIFYPNNKSFIKSLVGYKLGVFVCSRCVFRLTLLTSKYRKNTLFKQDDMIFITPLWTLDYGSALWYWEFPQLKYWLNLLDFGIEKNFSFIIVD